MEILLAIVLIPLVLVLVLAPGLALGSLFAGVIDRLTPAAGSGHTDTEQLLADTEQLLAEVEARQQRYARKHTP